MITAKTPVETLPTDINTLQQMVLQLLADVDAKTHRLQDLQHQLEWFKRHTFGRKSERYDPNQKLLFEMLEEQLKAKSSELLASQDSRLAEGWLDIRQIAFPDPNVVPELPAGVIPRDVAKWAMASRVLLNLDETISKN